MDKALTREESQQLMELLGLPMVQYGNLPAMRKAFLQKCKILHPDKGGNEEQMKTLMSLYKKLEDHLKDVQDEEFWAHSWRADEVPSYGTPEWDSWWQHFNKDLHCHENLEESDEEEPGCSQSTPPKKKKRQDNPRDLPECLKDFLSQAIFSNKTQCCFVIYTTKEKGPFLHKKIVDKFHPLFISRHSFEMNNILYFLTPNKHRVSAINNFSLKFCSVSFVIVKAVIKEYLCYSALCRDPFKLLEESVPGGLSENFFNAEEVEDVKCVSWKKVSEFALAIMCEDVHLLMGLYLEFQEEPENCSKCANKILPNHYNFHKLHFENALLFADCKNQKSICQQAVDAVVAKLRVESLVLSREQLLINKFKKHFEKMDLMFGSLGSANLEHFMGGVAWFDCLFPTGIANIIYAYLKCIVYNIPKKRYWLFKGPVNSGKTTLAAALLDLCGGKALNINLPFDKINFELGVAIDQFTVVFEDVKGQPSGNKDLPSGQGVSNLDNLRDYLDGSVKVNLEKKHLNKRTQIFPPGIVTMNEYFVPFTLKARFTKMLSFKPQVCLHNSLKQTEEIMRFRILQSGVTLLLLLIYHLETSEFKEELHPLVNEWKERIDREVGDSRYLEMKENVLAGINILTKRAGGTPPASPLSSPPSSPQPPTQSTKHSCQENDSGFDSMSMTQ
ncbi:large T antigen [Betapolyomavirus mafricanus]|uniref:Large T antigen n=1 Tax=Betapolyomavirus mafricanus TaxID=1891769 RepID=L0GBB8_9POLY|nr:large T antigen [Betapolyomavirus mafricanus]AGA82593.1 large T antigen [Betapolyomavirus mafricanus]